MYLLAQSYIYHHIAISTTTKLHTMESETKIGKKKLESETNGNLISLQIKFHFFSRKNRNLFLDASLNENQYLFAENLLSCLKRFDLRP